MIIYNFLKSHTRKLDDKHFGAHWKVGVQFVHSMIHIITLFSYMIENGRIQHEDPHWTFLKMSTVFC